MGLFEIPREMPGQEEEATDDEENAAEKSMMIKTAEPRDANISRLQLCRSLLKSTIYIANS